MKTTAHIPNKAVIPVAAACLCLAAFSLRSDESIPTARDAIKAQDLPFPLELEWRKSLRPENNAILAQAGIVENLRRSAEFDAIRAQPQKPMQHLSDFRAIHILSLIRQNEESSLGLVVLTKYMKEHLPKATSEDRLTQAQTDFLFVMSNPEAKKFICSLYRVRELDCSEYSAALCACIAARVGIKTSGKDLIAVDIVGGAYFPPEKGGAAVLHQWLEMEGRVVDPSVRPDAELQVRALPATHYVPLMKRTVWFSSQMTHPTADVWLYYLP
ncbi:MAG: hypothetical protein J0M12_17250 [Deltaproteobacteria bacterium]|nr:hypothetical protein [Deltaproteobacteria bacterium]